MVRKPVDSTIWSYTLSSCASLYLKDNKDKLSEIVEKRVHEPLDMWCTFFARSKLLDKDSLPPQLNYGELRKALKVLETINFTPEEWEVYDARLKMNRDENAGSSASF